MTANLSILRAKFQLLLFTICICFFALPETNASQEQKAPPQPEYEIGVEVVTNRDGKTDKPTRFFPTVEPSGVYLPIDHLIVTDRELVKDFEFVYVGVKYVKDAVQVQVSMSDGSFFTRFLRKVVGEYSVRDGEEISTIELKQFGIEPFQIRGISRAITPFIDPRVRLINKTQAIKVIEIKEGGVDSGDEKGYSLLLKNVSDKDIAAVYFAYGKRTRGTGSFGRDFQYPGFPAGTFISYYPRRFNAGFFGDFLTDEITITCVVFEDGTCEGDQEIAAHLFTEARAMKFGSPKYVLLVEDALLASDEELPSKLEQLNKKLQQSTHSSLDKESPDLVNTLKKQFPSLNKDELRELKWSVVSGWGAGRILHSVITDVEVFKRLKEEETRIKKPKMSLEQFIRARLVEAKKQYERIINAKW